MALMSATSVLLLLPAMGQPVTMSGALGRATPNPSRIQLCQGMDVPGRQQELENPGMQQRDLEMGDDAVRQDRLEQGNERQQQLEAPDQRQQDLDTPGAADQDDDDGDQ